MIALRTFILCSLTYVIGWIMGSASSGTRQFKPSDAIQEAMRTYEADGGKLILYNLKNPLRPWSEWEIGSGGNLGENHDLD